MNKGKAKNEYTFLYDTKERWGRDRASDKNVCVCICLTCNFRGKKKTFFFSDGIVAVMRVRTDSQEQKTAASQLHR